MTHLSSWCGASLPTWVCRKNKCRSSLIVLPYNSVIPHEFPQVVVIPDPSIFVSKDSEINMPIVSVNIRDTAATNSTEEDSMSFVTTLSNVNNDPPKENIAYCVNTTDLFTLTFAYEVKSRESAFRFDLLYPTMNIFLRVRLRLVWCASCLKQFISYVASHVVWWKC